MTEFSVTPVRWSRHHHTLADIRRRVFMAEQGVSEADEWDGRDRAAQHFLLWQGSTAIGCARVVCETRGQKPCLHIGRVAVVRSHRGRGGGRRLMRDLLQWCLAEHTEPQIELDAQVTVLDFYQRLGFALDGPVFLDAGIEHRPMIWRGSQSPASGGSS